MDRTPIEQIAHKIKNGESLTDAERDTASRIVMIAGQAFYKMTGVMFISGWSGDIPGDGLPKNLFVCPGFGSDISGLYVKHEPKHAEAAPSPDDEAINWERS